MLSQIAPEEYKRLKEAEHRFAMANLELRHARAEERRAWHAFQRAIKRAVDAATVSNVSDDLPHGAEHLRQLAGVAREWGA